MTEIWTQHNQVDLLENGAAYFPALQAAIDAAEQIVYLQTYIFADDAIGRAVATTLVAAARRGVTVRVMVDGFGTRHLSPEWVGGMKAAGVEWLIFHPERSRFSLRRYRLRRMHRKVVVVDNRLAFIGGINIIDDMNAFRPPRHDYAVRVQGEVVRQIADDVRRLWIFVAWVHGYAAHEEHVTTVADAVRIGEEKTAYVVRDNLRYRWDIEEAYLSAIASATQTVLIANAYFLPGLRFRRALMEAAQRGVEVILLLQWQPDHRLLQYATQAWYGRLLASGVKICEFHRGFLHAKVAVIDGHWATVGSSNIDPFSLLLAREANLLIDSSRFAAELSAALQRTIHNGGKWVEEDGWRKRPWYQRILPYLTMLLMRGLMGLLGYGQNW